jgi:hypothetical protein
MPTNDEELVQVPDVSLGAPGWKQLWPKAVWPGEIQGMPPIAIRVSTDAEITPNQPVHLNFNFPSTLGLYFAGPAGDTFSFFGQVVLQGSTNAIFMDRAYGQFRLQPEKIGTNLFNIKLGRIDTRAEPFASTFRKPTLLHMNAGDYRVFSDGFAFRDHDAGVELWGAATGPDDRGGLEYGVGIVQGTNGRTENNNSKDYYWSGSYKFGGLGVAGSRNDDTTLGTDSDIYSEWSLAVGTFGYRGKRRTSTVPGNPEDQLTRWGLKFDAYLDDLNLFGAFVSGQDNIRSATPSSIKTTAFFVQADYMLLPWVMPTIRLEKSNFSNGRRYKALVATTNFAIRANVRAVVEGIFYGGRQAETNYGLVRLEFLF